MLKSNTILFCRSYKQRKLCQNDDFGDLGPYHPKYTGIPESYGIFYAMGAALMFEGIFNLFLFISQETTQN